MKTYVPQLDYLKSIFIALMILFHLVYIGDTYPYMKQVVYTFHMPVFLILSGYLSHTRKSTKQFLCSVWWLFVPYAIMETGYILAASVLPVRESVGELNLRVLLTKVFIDPIGPYWYLHTLIVCRTVHYTVAQLVRERLSQLSFLIVLGLCYWGLSESLGVMDFGYSMFFLAGIGIRTCKVQFLTIFQSSAWSFVPLVILCSKQENLLDLKLAGVIITYLAISLSLWIYPYLPARTKEACLLIGQNTLPILLFSPLFTMLSRIYLPLFMFDASGCCFAIFTIVLTIFGCLTIIWCMDKTKLSRWIFGREKTLKLNQKNLLQ